MIPTLPIPALQIALAQRQRWSALADSIEASGQFAEPAVKAMRAAPSSEALQRFREWVLALARKDPSARVATFRAELTAAETAEAAPPATPTPGGVLRS